MGQQDAQSIFPGPAHLRLQQLDGASVYSPAFLELEEDF